MAYVKSGQTKIITLAAVTTEAAAETKTETTTAAENEIRRILAQYYAIARTNDRAALKNFSREVSTPEYLYTSELGTMDKTTAFRLFDSMKIEFASADFDDLTVQIHGDTAIAKYRDFSKVRANGDFVRTPMRFTNVWV
ncbi:MAG: nuclear transport factor 2 family protein [Pyrinomonadaceae bacterium]|nr:nuclear transport factor 2 family protein [Pyrinomonadaceae bacterium]